MAHRLKLKNLPTGAPSIIIQHGLGGGSPNFVWGPVEVAPGFVAANAGYDVWLPNDRGNSFSWENKNFTKGAWGSYWDYNVEELGTIDKPETIDYILKETGNKELAGYIGISQGTSQFYAGATLMPDFYEEKVKLFIGVVTPYFHCDPDTIGYWFKR